MKSRVGMYVSGLLVLMSALGVACGGTEETPGNQQPGVNYEAPKPPTDVVVTPGDAQLSVSWKAPSFNGGKVITGYTVRALEGQSVRGEAKAAAGATSAVLTGLTNGVAYIVTVSAENAVGATASEPSATMVPRKVLGAPRDVQATPGNRQVALSWTPPEATGIAVTGYTVTVRSGETVVATKQSTEPTLTVTDLTNGTPYAFTVTATNSDGVGPSAASVTSTPRTVPGPLKVAGNAYDGKMRVDWQPADDDGGSPILGYRVYFMVEATQQQWEFDVGPDVFEHFVTGLTNGQYCQFSAAARNAAGVGPHPQVVRGKPVGLPSAPRNFTGHSEVGQVRFTWDLPENDGGDPVRYCVISFENGYDQPRTVLATTTEYVAGSGIAAGTVFNVSLYCSNLTDEPGPSATATATIL